MPEYTTSNIRSCTDHLSLTKNYICLALKTDKCDNCDDTETISHLFFECHTAQNLWHEISRWLGNRVNSAVHLDKYSILLGNTKNEITINRIILITKHEIYKRKWNANNLSLPKLKRIIKSHMDFFIFQTFLFSCVLGNHGYA